MQTKPAIFFLTVFLTVLLFSSLIHPAFATTIFSDGFESGDFSAWTGTAYSGTAPTVVTDYVHHGTYSMKASFTKDTEYGVAYKTVTSAKEYYMRSYVRLSATPPSNTGATIMPYLKDQTNNIILGRVTVKNNAGTLQVGAAYYNNGVKTSYYVNQSFSAGTWYCVELRVVCGSGTGIVQVWWDGTKIIDVQNLNNNYNIERAYVGVGAFSDDYPTTAWSLDVRHDCVVVADTYIGPEAAGQEYSFTLTETVKPSAALNVWQEHAYTLSQTIIQTSILQYGAEATQTLTETATPTETILYWQEQSVVFTQSTTLTTILTYAAELAEVFIVNIETVNPQGNMYYWIEELITPLDWSMIALGMAVIAFVVAAAAFALK